MTFDQFLIGQKQSPKQSSGKRGVKKTRIPYVADFETTTTADDCRVWAWGLAAIEFPDDVEIGLDIESFLDRISDHNAVCYFHNLKFDGHFIIDYLLRHGFFHVSDSRGEIGPESFKTLISDMGKYFSITVRWGNGHTTEFRDSLKKLPMTVKRIATSFNLEEGKGEIDYHAIRPLGHIPTDEEKDYLRRDVSIIGHAMKEVIANGMTKLTIASDAMAEYKKLTGKGFDSLFPVFPESMDAEIRRAYRGGFTYADPRFKGRITRSGLVLDVNSLYPFVMYSRYLPYGVPEYVEGKVLPTDERPLTVFSVTFTARIKPKHIPCIQIKGSSIFHTTEYLSEIKDPVTLMVTNVDWQLYNDHYDIDVQAYGGGWRFHAAKGMFDAYITKWARIKEDATGGKREIAKLHLNSLYGKFASNPNVTSKIPVLKDDAVHLVRGPDEKRPPIYTAVGVFITAFAREVTIRAAQKSYDTFAYADTDSLHLLQDTPPTDIEIHPSRMGAWKQEYVFEAAFYVRAKAYFERHPDGTYTNRIAGVPEHMSSQLTFADLFDGHVLHGKLHPKSVPGGVVLSDVPFELKL